MKFNDEVRGRFLEASRQYFKNQDYTEGFTAISFQQQLKAAQHFSA